MKRKHLKTGAWPGHAGSRHCRKDRKVIDDGCHSELVENAVFEGIQYNIVHTYPNGVRVGNVPKHKEPLKTKGIGQSWFPKNWNREMIKKAGEYVANLKRNHNIGNGITAFGTYKGVRVGIKKTNGKISTVFPDSDQSKALNHKRGKNEHQE